MQDPVLTPEVLLQAYAMGVFPMAEDANDQRLFWLDPDERGIFPLDGFHISRSLKRDLQRRPVRAILNRDFGATVAACADRDTTWINAPLKTLYQGLYEIGHAHALEVWEDDTCLGGVFGVTVGAAFCGESMYSARTNGSKLALAFLVAHLRQSGFNLFDTQFLTDHLASLGAIEVSRSDYHVALETALKTQPDLTATVLPSRHDLLQRKTQTS